MPDITPRFPSSEQELALRLQGCVRAYWEARGGQSRRQEDGGVKDAGTRGEVTGGQHLNAFVQLLSEIIRSAGYSESKI